MSLAASDIAGTPKESRRPIGLLLVAIPVLLVGWMVIYPIISAVVTTLWLPDETGVHSLSFSTYTFFFSDGYSLSLIHI